ncbi:MAG: DUF4418 family protein [Oscillospiraceae bacterium]|nr:DUF4418 family protein [Oscillospiraceae bacterium]
MWLNLAGLILSVILLIAVFTWAKPCSGQLELANGNFVAMKCVYTGKALALISAALIVIALENIAKKRSAPFAFIILGLAFIIVTFSGALGIGVCVKEGMACHATALWARVIGALTLIDGIVMLLNKGEKDL